MIESVYKRVWMIIREISSAASFFFNAFQTAEGYAKGRRPFKKLYDGMRKIFTPLSCVSSNGRFAIVLVTIITSLPCSTNLLDRLYVYCSTPPKLGRYWAAENTIFLHFKILSVHMFYTSCTFFCLEVAL